MKSSRPIGIAVMALVFKFLQYTAADGKPTHDGGGGVGWRRGGGYKSYSSTYSWHRGKAQRQVDQSTPRGKAAHMEIKGDGCRYEGGGATAVAVRLGGHGQCWVGGVRTVG